MKQKMTITQSTLINDRLEAAFSKLEAGLKKAHTTPGREITARARCLLLSKGQVKVHRDLKEVLGHHDVEDVFDFSNFEYPEVLNEDAFKADVADLEVRANEVRDLIITGDAEGALKALKAFESGKV